MDAQAQTVLVIEDEPTLLLGLCENLSLEGFSVLSSTSGVQGLLLAKQSQPDGVLLDLMLPDMSGYAVCRALRQQYPLLPILMLTAMAQEEDKIRGFEAGADDYVTKPFSLHELLARMRAVLRRAAWRPGFSDAVRIGAGVVSFSTQVLSVRGKVHRLSFYEIGLLRKLVEHRGEPVSREELLSEIWGLTSSPMNRTVDNFVVKLRKKIEEYPEQPTCILTVYGFGYKLVG